MYGNEKDFSQEMMMRDSLKANEWYGALTLFVDDRLSVTCTYMS